VFAVACNWVFSVVEWLYKGRLFLYSMKKILTLWDIDGNLINAYKYHTPAYQKAIKEVYGVTPTFEEIEKNYGLPAKEVVAIPVRNLGVDEEKIQEGMEKVFSIYSKQLEEGIKADSKETILPGVSALLSKVKSLHIPMGVVTGNIKQAGEALIKGSNLFGFFSPEINSYGDTAKYRHEIVSAAIKHAQKNDFIDDGAKIYVFGDTPADVEAAKKNKCISVAVIKNSNEADSSPGGESYRKRKAALEEAEPDFLFDDYTNLEEILSIIGIEQV